MINTNYSNQNKTSFTARLDMHAADGMIWNKEVEYLKDVASRIGKPTDSIRVDIGKTNRWSVGNKINGDVFEGYPMKVTTAINGEIKEFKLDQSRSCFSNWHLSVPFSKLWVLFDRIEHVNNPEFRQGVLSKIDSQNADLANLVSEKKAIESGYATNKQSFKERSSAREFIMDRIKIVEKAILKSQKELEV